MPGAGKFFRGGHGFDEAGRVVELSPALYELLRTEKRLALDDVGAEEKPVAVLDIVDNCPAYDHAWNASRHARLEVERLKRENAAIQAELELAALAEENKKLKAAKASKAKP
jgi:hypothetical protein